MKNKFSGKKVFFKPAPDSRELNDNIDLYEFSSFEEAYTELMSELRDLIIEAIEFVIPAKDNTENIYITGGFSSNELFRNLIGDAFPSKQVFISEIANASALGAAVVISGKKPALNLGLTVCK